MSDVSINIRGRDDGLGNQLDSLRQKAQELGRDISELNNLSDLTSTEKKVAVGKIGDDTLRHQKEQIRSDYSDLRSNNVSDFSEIEDKFKSGEINKQSFDKYKAEFQVNQKELTGLENSEILEVEKEMNQTLRDIYKEMTQDSKIERERRQIDNAEFKSGGLVGGLSQQNAELRRQQLGSDDEEEVARLQSEIEANNARIRNLRSGDQEGDDGEFGFREVGGTLASAGRGDLMGTVQGGLQAGGALTGAVKGFTIAGLVAMILKETIGHGESLEEALAPVSAFRGSGATNAQTNLSLRDINGDLGADGRFDFGSLGLKNTDVAAMMREKALASGIAGKDLVGRTIEDDAFKKAFGGDAGQFSQFERFTKGQEDATEIAMNVLNVLTSIEKSSLKETDLSTLTEKLAAQNTILSLQRAKRDSVDSDASLQILSAFESVGLSGKGEKAGNFLSQTIQGLGEGGSDNLMMLKLEAAKRARPDLANDPAALRRLVRFNSDNPEYMSEFFKMAGGMTEGNEMAQDDLLYSFFNPESEADMEMYKKAMKGGDFQKLLSGKGLAGMKARKSTLDEDTMMTEASSGYGMITEAMNDFGNRSQGMIDQILQFFSGAMSEDSVNVNIVKDKTKAVAPTRGNTYHTGGNE